MIHELIQFVNTH